MGASTVTVKARKNTWSRSAVMKWRSLFFRSFNNRPKRPCAAWVSWVASVRLYSSVTVFSSSWRMYATLSEKAGDPSLVPDGMLGAAGVAGPGPGVSGVWGVAAMGVSSLGVSSLGVSSLGVSSLGVSALGVSSLGVGGLAGTFLSSLAAGGFKVGTNHSFRRLVLKKSSAHCSLFSLSFSLVNRITSILIAPSCLRFSNPTSMAALRK
ncbi:MAG: hypothetical protein JXB05_02785 [Myxococcaceae bacterium]|nr:hypothetical protein [Myxococcaceae bacterium]